MLVENYIDKEELQGAYFERDYVVGGCLFRARKWARRILDDPSVE
jgi:hypothetical protein